MKFHEEVIYRSFVAFVLWPKFSKQLTEPGDCIPFKQYWSTEFINKNGACAPCPSLFETCSEQGADRKSCEDSCFAKSTTPPLKPVATPPYTPPKYSSVPSNVSTPVDQPKKYKETTHFDINVHPWLIALLLLGSLLVFLASIVVVLLLYIRKLKKKDETNGNMENGTALELLQRNDEGDQNNGEERAHVPNDVEGCVQVPNGAEGRAHVANDNEHPQEPSVVEEHACLPNDAEEHAYARYFEGPVQERERPFIIQPTASNRSIKGILEENLGSSLDVHVEIHN